MGHLVDDGLSAAEVTQLCRTWPYLNGMAKNKTIHDGACCSFMIETHDSTLDPIKYEKNMDYEDSIMKIGLLDGSLDDPKDE